MIISHNYKWAFIHNPKACGTSIRDQLSRYHDDHVKYWHQGWDTKEQRVVDLAHLQASYWYEDKLVPHDYITFGFVREPYTRFLSAWNETRRRHPYLFANEADFMKMLTPANIRHDWRFIHFCPQHSFFFVGQKRVVDFIGKFETVDKDWRSVLATLGQRIPADVGYELPLLRPSASTTQLMTQEVIQLVNDLYYRDFMLFGYEMVGTISADSYAARMEIIHDPVKFGTVDLGRIKFNINEQKALDAKLGEGQSCD